MTPSGIDAVVMFSAAGAIVSVSACVAVCVGVCASPTSTVKLLLPGALGVPDITPPDVNESPPGNAPATSVQLYGATPPLAASEAL